jgi:ABC-2 type transport system permease protein
MNNYIGADLRRIFQKQSFLWAFGAFAGCFVLLVFIYWGPSFTAEMYVSKMTSFMSYFPLMVGLLTFLSVYADDFKCRSMQIAIGYGMPRGRIIFAKLLESAILLLTTAAGMAVLLIAAPLLLGLAPTSQQTASLVLTTAAEFLRALGYIAISAVVVFLTQNATGGTILYVPLSSKSIYIILTMLLGQDFLPGTVGDLTEYLYTALLYTCKTGLTQGGQPYVSLIFALFVYVALPTIISVVGFCKKELEF